MQHAAGVRRVEADDLVLAAGTLRTASFVERVGAAAAAGFAGIGMSMWEYMRLREDGWTDAALRQVLDDHGVHLAEIEAILGFDRTGPVDLPGMSGRIYSDPRVEAAAFAMAAAFEARHVQAVASFGHAPRPDVVEAFAALCDRAAEHGLLVALEFLPVSTIPDAAAATRVVSEAGRSNGGLCVDSWHFYRGAGTEADLRAIPGDRVFVIQLDDGPGTPRDPDYLTDTTRYREMPGEGEFDLVRFLQALWSTGAGAPLSVEVLSDAHDSRPQDEVARDAAESTRRLLSASGRS